MLPPAHPAHCRPTPRTRTVIPTMSPSGGPGVRTVCWEASFVNLEQHTTWRWCHGGRGAAAAPLGGSSGQFCTSCPSRTTHPTPRPDQSLLADGGTTEIATKLQQPLQPQLMKGDVGACVVGAQHAPFSVCGSRSPAHRSWSTNPPSQLSLSWTTFVSTDP